MGERLRCALSVRAVWVVLGWVWAAGLRVGDGAAPSLRRARKGQAERRRRSAGAWGVWSAQKKAREWALGLPAGAERRGEERSAIR